MSLGARNVMINMGIKILISISPNTIILFLFKFPYIFIVFSVCHSMNVEVREQLVDVDSLIPPCGFWGLNIGHQVWQLVSLPTESCHCPRPYILNLNVY